VPGAPVPIAGKAEWPSLPAPGAAGLRAAVPRGKATGRAGAGPGTGRPDTGVMAPLWHRRSHSRP
jgi:hypothetical protein